MPIYTQLLLLLCLVIVSALLNCAEIALASARNPRLQRLADKGDSRAKLVISLQNNPRHIFSAIQIGINALILSGGIVSEALLSPVFKNLFTRFLPFAMPPGVSFAVSLIIATLIFVVFADLLPKRLALVVPESTAIRLAKPITFFVRLLHPVAYLLDMVADGFIRLFGLPSKNQRTITPEDILASVGEGAAAGVIDPQEEAVIQNVFDLESRLVPSAMTARENIVYFTLDAPEEEVRKKIASVLFNRFVVCDKDLDHVVGYVDSTHILRQVLSGKPISLKEPGVVLTCPFIPDSLTLSEVLDLFQRTRSDFAVILNEYALVVGVITLNDVMSTVMGDLVAPDERQIVERDDGTWLVDGSTPIDDIEYALDIDHFPEDSTYETAGGFMMYMLRKIPKRTDRVTWAGYTFEVIGVDNNKIDQILVSRAKTPANSA